MAETIAEAKKATDQIVMMFRPHQISFSALGAAVGAPGGRLCWADASAPTAKPLRRSIAPTGSNE
jgi:hypothetical protein